MEDSRPMIFESSSTDTKSDLAEAGNPIGEANKDFGAVSNVLDIASTEKDNMTHKSSSKRVRKKRKSKRQIQVEIFFKDMDVEFVKRVNVEDDVFVYAAKNVVIQKSLEIPIMLQWPNATIEYEFSSEPSNLKFAIVFIPALEEGQTYQDLVLETLFQAQAVNTADPMSSSKINTSILGHEWDSDSVQEKIASDKVIRGKFTLDREGALFFQFDVDDSWWSSLVLAPEAHVSYCITAQVPSFNTVDVERSEQAAYLMRENLEILNTSLAAFEDCETAISGNMESAEVMQAEIEQLQQILTAKRDQKRIAEQAEIDSLTLLRSSYERMNGLCIRMLSRHLLCYVMGYLSTSTKKMNIAKSKETEFESIGSEVELDDRPLTTRHTGNCERTTHSAVGLVCKYWNQCYSFVKHLGPISCAEPRPPRLSAMPDLHGLRLQRVQMASARSSTENGRSRMKKPVRIDANGERMDKSAAVTEPAQVLLSTDESKASAALTDHHSVESKRNQVSNSNKFGARNTTAQNLEIAKKLFLQKSQQRSELRQTSRSKAAGSAEPTPEADFPDPHFQLFEPDGVQKSTLTHAGLAVYAAITTQMDRAASLRKQKKTVKATIKNWANNFLLEYGRSPTSAEKRESMGSYYDEYNRVSQQLATHTARLMRGLEENGLTVADLQGM